MLNLIVNNVSKQLKRKTILSNIYLNLKSRNIYGFVGENSSGKLCFFGQYQD